MKSKMQSLGKMSEEMKELASYVRVKGRLDVCKFSLLLLC